MYKQRADNRTVVINMANRFLNYQYINDDPLTQCGSPQKDVGQLTYAFDASLFREGLFWYWFNTGNHRSIVIATILLAPAVAFYGFAMAHLPAHKQAKRVPRLLLVILVAKLALIYGPGYFMCPDCILTCLLPSATLAIVAGGVMTALALKTVVTRNIDDALLRLMVRWGDRVGVRRCKTNR